MGYSLRLVHGRKFSFRFRPKLCSVISSLCNVAGFGCTVGLSCGLSEPSRGGVVAIFNGAFQVRDRFGPL